MMGGSTQLHPDYPIVEGRHRLAARWSIRLTDRFNRRFEEDALVLWKPGLTMWASVIESGLETLDRQRTWVESVRSDDASQIQVEERGDVRYWSYRLAEKSEDDRRPSLHCLAFAGGTHVSMGIYFDVEREAEAARTLCLSLRHED